MVGVDLGDLFGFEPIVGQVPLVIFVPFPFVLESLTAVV